MRLLIIEDDLKIAEILKTVLSRQGHAADCLADGDAGQKRIELHHKCYDAVILDLSLPRVSGLEICRNIRKLGITIPILVITARDGLDDKLMLLDSGADDYLVKPFQCEEAIARLRAITRRPSLLMPAVLSAGKIVLNPASKKVFVGSREIKLTLKEFRLLEFLMKHPKQVVEKEDIIDNLWDFNFDSFSNVVDVYISKLRMKIGRIDGKGIIETVHGVGYRIKV